MASINISNVWKRFGDTVALHDLSMNINDGEFFVLFGPAGAGKTTTLNLIAGFIKPTAGDIFIGDRLVNEVPENKRSVAMAFENYSLYPHFSVYDNLANPLRSPGNTFTNDEIRNRVTKTAEMLGISSLLERRPHQLSGGQKQRVALGRSLVKDVDVLLLDEPLAHVDAKIRNELRTEFHRMEALKTRTTLYVTHDYMDAMSLADRVGIINQGALHMVGVPKEIYESPVDIFTAESVGWPKINLIECEVKEIKGEVVLFNAESNLQINPTTKDAQALRNCNIKKVVVGFRGQYMQISTNEDEKNNILPGLIEVFLPLGTFGHLTVKNAGIVYNVVVDPDLRFNHKESIRLKLDEKQFNYFDPETKKNILCLQNS